MSTELKSAETVTHTHAETNCPTCEAPLNASDNYKGDGKPDPGDFSICAYCATFLRFDQQLRLRLMTTEEIAALEDETRIALQRARRAIEIRNQGLSR